MKAGDIGVNSCLGYYTYRIVYKHVYVNAHVYAFLLRELMRPAVNDTPLVMSTPGAQVMFPNTTLSPGDLADCRAGEGDAQGES